VGRGVARVVRCLAHAVRDPAELIPFDATVLTKLWNEDQLLEDLSGVRGRRIDISRAYCVTTTG